MFEIESIERLGSDHIHLVQKIQLEDIAISECCRGQNTSIYIYMHSNHHSAENHEDKLKLKTNQMQSHCKNNAMSETLQTEKFWWWRYPPYRKY